MIRFCGEAVLNKKINEKQDASEQPGSSVVDTQTQASYFKVVPAFNSTGAGTTQQAAPSETFNSDYDQSAVNHKK